MLTARSRTTRAAIAAVLGAGALAIGGAATPANAADELQLSNDGSTWSSTLGSDVFAQSRSLIPGSTVDGTFFVRNATTSPAWIRVGVSELTVTSEDLALSLRLSAAGSTGSGPGAATSLTGAGIVCSDFLVRSTPVPPGGVIRVDASLAMRSSVSGDTAQAQAARLEFVAEISDVDLNALDVPLCDATMTIDPSLSSSPGSPGSPGSGGDGTQTGETTETTESGSPGTRPTSGIATALAAISGGSLDIGGVSRPLEATNADLPYNSVHWYEEYAILVLIGAAAAGAIARFSAQRRWVDDRRRKAGDS